ncbi:hypothetical protein SIXOD_v1c24360 [Spiroplasma ixodetis Y32]|uniref:hypothetical protein n=1 Tax=unclassified Spiroplasma TaxID=2637901 RepID=UPI0030D49D11|nr:hypothetical protein SIXOD_v1c24360 [Spiroplasma ixodetis Y32]
MTIQSTGGAGTTIWERKTNDKHIIDLYFDKDKRINTDLKWDGQYPKGYFNW